MPRRLRRRPALHGRRALEPRVRAATAGGVLGPARGALLPLPHRGGLRGHPTQRRRRRRRRRRLRRHCRLSDGSGEVSAGHD